LHLFPNQISQFRSIQDTEPSYQDDYNRPLLSESDSTERTPFLHNMRLPGDGRLYSVPDGPEYRVLPASRDDRKRVESGTWPWWQWLVLFISFIMLSTTWYNTDILASERSGLEREKRQMALDHKKHGEFLDRVEIVRSKWTVEVRERDDERKG